MKYQAPFSSARVILMSLFQAANFQIVTTCVMMAQKEKKTLGEKKWYNVVKSGVGAYHLDLRSPSEDEILNRMLGLECNV